MLVAAAQIFSWYMDRLVLGLGSLDTCITHRAVPSFRDPAAVHGRTSHLSLCSPTHKRLHYPLTPLSTHHSVTRPRPQSSKQYSTCDTTIHSFKH